MKRILAVAAAVAAAGLVAVFLVVYLSKDAIGYSQKCGGSYCWGYRLEQYRYLKRTTLTFWGSWGLRIEYSLPPVHIERVNDDRWLDTDRAIYLNLEFKPKEEAPGDRVRILYDFQRGTLHVTSALGLWRVGDFRSGVPQKNWLNAADFEKALLAIEP
jgi:hypothetical protein